MSRERVPLVTDKITEQERQHVDLAGNLSDAQVYLPLTPAQLSALPGRDHFNTPRSAQSMPDLRHRFYAAFARLHEGLPLPADGAWFEGYSASSMIEIAANVLRLGGARKVGLLHPTFDATAHILRRHDLTLVPVEDKDLAGGLPEDILHGLDALVLTLPNNPTGRDIGATAFAALARAARRQGVVLVIDACFRAYTAAPVPHHAILARAGTDAIVIEDTGKLFQAKDIKLGAAWVRGRLHPSFHAVHCDFILDPPIFVLELVTRLLEASGPAHRARLGKIVARNRRTAITALQAAGLRAVGDGASNVQLFALPSGICAAGTAAAMAARRVGIVDGNAYFWQSRRAEFVRLALARTPDEFDRHLDVFVSLLKATSVEASAAPAG